ncbi:manganese transport protein [Rhizomicrobium palustre]|uniref:Divalent metal cation transporter MntH n=1 Tax=Rhizomicrobium palustre TaxID=189966 RepID=A0A846MZS4_9PROT|nr:Nramp family divalent metal transporter [Rhizomicrobium palustre]NIK89118.1 manganese transport protein [Rhizomicrobium palustre]
MTVIDQTIGLTERTILGMRDVLTAPKGSRRGWRTAMLFAGPAVISSIAYMDPGNVATNIQAGAKFGYALLWVVLAANLVAMLFQSLSAKLGIVTGKNLAELSREEFPKPVVLGMWGISEIAAMATDLAEFLGGALGISLLFHVPLMVGMVATGVITYALLSIQNGGFRPMEIAIAVLIAVIGVSYLVELAMAPVDWSAAAKASVTPTLPNGEALTIAVGIIGATIMPHAVYLHSGLTQSRAPARTEPERAMLLRFSNREVIVALAIAGLINMAAVVLASAAFHSGHPEVAEIQTAYHMLTPLLGAGAGFIFLISLIASGISSSTVGTLAGQMIMQGFTSYQIPIWARRLITMAPAFVVVALGVNPTSALVISQVVLSFALPVPMLALIWFTRRKDIMGAFANSRLTDAAAIGGAAVVLSLNAVLLWQMI